VTLEPAIKADELHAALLHAIAVDKESFEALPGLDGIQRRPVFHSGECLYGVSKARPAGAVTKEIWLHGERFAWRYDIALPRTPDNISRELSGGTPIAPEQSLTHSVMTTHNLIKDLILGIVTRHFAQGILIARCMVIWKAGGHWLKA
jgi:hypothetical protein